jgi:hypothetical protein
MSKLKVLVSRSFLDDAFIRAIRTFFQAALAFIGVNVVAVSDINYIGAASIGAGAALISFAQSVIRVATAKIEENPFDAESEIASFNDDVSDDDVILGEIVDLAIKENGEDEDAEGWK